MAIKIDETEDGRYEISIDGETMTLTYDQASRLKQAIQYHVLRVPRAIHDQVRHHWRAIQKGGYLERMPGGKRRFGVSEMFNEKEILFTPGRPRNAKQINISPEYYIRQLDDQDQERAKEFWDQYL